MQITDIFGKVIIDYPNANGIMELQIDLSIYAKGVYLARVTNNSGINFVKKITVQ